MSQSRGLKVAVLGAGGGIGQPLALLCKLSPQIDEVACYDVAPVTPGVAADLSHCPTKAKLTGHMPSSGTWPPSGNSGLEAALTGAEAAPEDPPPSPTPSQPPQPMREKRECMQEKYCVECGLNLSSSFCYILILPWG